MNCPRCQSTRIYQFEAAPAAQERPTPSELPAVCRDCGQITIGGKPARFPENLEKATLSLAEAEAKAAETAGEELEEVDRVEVYMKNFYRAAYLDGFFRALAFFRHNAKEGRLVRLRKLWEEGMGTGGSTETHGMVDGKLWPREGYTEFEQLLYLNAVPGESDAKSHSNKHPSKQEDHSRVS